jgi:hypothetical protein
MPTHATAEIVEGAYVYLNLSKLGERERERITRISLDYTTCGDTITW